MKDVIDVPAGTGRIGFCADLHGVYDNVLALRERRPDIETWFCAGDVVDMYKAVHYNQPTLRIMHRLGIPSVLGNHDHHVKKTQLRRLDEEAKTYLEALPFRLTVHFAGLRIRLYHATPTSLDDFIADGAGEKTYAALFANDEADVIVLGHTHTPYVKTFGDTRFINPGALGIPDVQPSYCILDHHGNAEIVYLEDGDDN